MCFSPRVYANNLGKYPLRWLIKIPALRFWQVRAQPLPAPSQNQNKGSIVPRKSGSLAFQFPCGRSLHTYYISVGPERMSKNSAWGRYAATKASLEPPVKIRYKFDHLLYNPAPMYFFCVIFSHRGTENLQVYKCMGCTHATFSITDTRAVLMVQPCMGEGDAPHLISLSLDVFSSHPSFHLQLWQQSSSSGKTTWLPLRATESHTHRAEKRYCSGVSK